MNDASPPRLVTHNPRRWRANVAPRATGLIALLSVAAACSSSSPSANPSPKPAAGSTTVPSSTTASTMALLPTSSEAIPVTTGPVQGGTPDRPVNAMPAELRTKYDYTEKEFFFSGTATAFQTVGQWTPDGKWRVAPSTRAQYKTRMIVRAPKDPAKFNGTVIVEWLNESGGQDADPDFGFAGPELLRDGFAYVGVSAQAIGTVGGTGLVLPIPGYSPKPLLKANPVRYKGLVHPGDDYSYDIFSQAAQAVRHPNGAKPLGALGVQRVIATGESQSAFRLVTYIDAIAPVAKVFDGYLVHSRGNNGAALNAQPAAAIPPVVHIRDDLQLPVMTIATETDLFGLSFFNARQPDTAMLRTWEMAGTAHADQSTLDYGIASGHTYSPGTPAPDFASLCGHINDGPQRFVVRRAFAALQEWVVHGTAPLHATPFTISGTAVARDSNGTALGGYRTPDVDVPTRKLDGTFDTSKSVICSLFGSTTPFTSATLHTLYSTHADYVTKVEASAKAAVSDGRLLPADATEIVDIAKAAAIP